MHHTTVTAETHRRQGTHHRGRRGRGHSTKLTPKRAGTHHCKRMQKGGDKGNGMGTHHRNRAPNNSSRSLHSPREATRGGREGTHHWQLKRRDDRHRGDTPPAAGYREKGHSTKLTPKRAGTHHCKRMQKGGDKRRGTHHWHAEGNGMGTQHQSWPQNNSSRSLHSPREATRGGREGTHHWQLRRRDDRQRGDTPPAVGHRAKGHSTKRDG